MCKWHREKTSASTLIFKGFRAIRCGHCTTKPHTKTRGENMAKYNTTKVVKLQGKEYILFEGLLEIAHAEYELSGIETNMIQLPNEDNGNEAICHAIVSTKDGKKFTGYGDASQKNVNKMILPHVIRMAETRAIGRALRFLTGFGTVFEELGEVDSSTPISSKQLGLIKTKVKGLAMSRGKKDEEVYQALKISNLESLTNEQALDALATLSRWEEQAKSAS